MNPEIKIYKNHQDIALHFSKKIKQIIDKKNSGRKNANILVSSDNIPSEMYEILANNYKHKIDWQMVHLFWTNETSHSTDNANSSYEFLNEHLLKQLNIPIHNIHPIIGHNHPFLEADRYSTVLHEHFNIYKEIPEFDIAILGLGKDGQIASIHSDQLGLFDSNRLYEVSYTPRDNAPCITATGKLLNNVANLLILAVGEEKAELIYSVLNGKENAQKYPVSQIKLIKGKMIWYLDKKSGKYL